MFLWNYHKFSWFQLKMNQSVCQTHTGVCRTHLLNLENTVKDYLIQNGKPSKVISLIHG